MIKSKLTQLKSLALKTKSDYTKGVRDVILIELLVPVIRNIWKAGSSALVGAVFPVWITKTSYGVGDEYHPMRRFLRWWGSETTPGTIKWGAASGVYRDSLVAGGTGEKFSFPYGLIILRIGGVWMVGYNRHSKNLVDATKLPGYILTFLGLPWQRKQMLTLVGQLFENASDNFIDCRYARSAVDSLDYQTQARDLDTLALPIGIRKKLITIFTEFEANEQHYLKWGIPYRMVILLHGTPGAGKTSLIRALATKFKRPLVFLDAAQLGNATPMEMALEPTSGGVFLRTLITTPPRSIIAVEDFPMSIVSDAAAGEGTPSQQTLLSQTLNALDGGIIPYGRVVILTTNQSPDDATEAFLRGERITHSINLSTLFHDDIVDYFERVSRAMEVDLTFDEHKYFQPINGNDLQKALRDNDYDLQKTMNALP